MKRLWALIVSLLILSGCGGNTADLDGVLALRSRLLNAAGCSFGAAVHADYGKDIHSFTLECKADEKGKVEFSVKEPTSISGISGTVSAEGGKLTFDDQALAFELLADGQLSPISAPWVLMKALRGGYIDACGMDGELMMATLNDSYADDALRVDVWLRSDGMPVGAEIYWQGRRILSIEVKNFQLL